MPFSQINRFNTFLMKIILRFMEILFRNYSESHLEVKKMKISLDNSDERQCGAVSSLCQVLWIQRWRTGRSLGRGRPASLTTVPTALLCLIFPLHFLRIPRCRFHATMAALRMCPTPLHLSLFHTFWPPKFSSAISLTTHRFRGTALSFVLHELPDTQQTSAGACEIKEILTAPE